MNISGLKNRPKASFLECPSIVLSTTSNVGLLVSCTKEKGQLTMFFNLFRWIKDALFYSENKPLTFLLLGGKDEAESTEVKRQAAKETKCCFCKCKISLQRQ